jgi:hypothetical protein
MFKTKLLAAALAFGVAGVAHAGIQTGANPEIVFSAWDSAAGVGYTYDLQDIGFNDVFGSNVALNSLIGSTNTVANVGTTLVQSPSNGIIFDLALPSFGDFVNQTSAANVQWNLLSVDVAGIYRVLQTVAVAPASADTNNRIINWAGAFNSYAAQVTLKGTHPGGFAVDGYAITTEQDGLAYAGNPNLNLKGQGLINTGSLDDELALYVVSTSSNASNQQLGRIAGVLDADGNSIVAKVYQGEDGYRLQIAVAPVPEPETYAMLLAGLGLLGFAARRNKRA